MRTTQEYSQRIEHGGYVTPRGYAYCNDCAGERFEFAQHYQWVEAGSIDGLCDGCDRAFTDCTPRTIEGTATIEHVECKIF